MNSYDYRKLIDLFLDDDLPLELALDFKEAMFSDPDLRAEVSEARRVKEMFFDAFAFDHMTEIERHRVFSRIAAEGAAREAAQQGNQPETLQFGDQFNLPLSG